MSDPESGPQLPSGLAVWARARAWTVSSGLETLYTGSSWETPGVPLEGRRRSGHRAPARDGRGGQRRGWEGAVGLWGHEEGAQSRAQRRRRSRSAPSRAERGAAPPLQREPEQHCLTILPEATGHDVHSYLVLVLGHLGAQRLLSVTTTCDPEGGRQQVAASLQEAGWGGGRFPHEPGSPDST